MARVKTYDPRHIIMSLGSHIVRGYADGTFVNIEPHGDGVTKEVGADGEVARSIDPDETLTITINLQYGSDTIRFCQSQYNKDRQTGGDGMFPVLIKDLKGGMVCSAAEAWVVNNPSREYAKDLSGREIVIDTGIATLTD